LEEIAVVADESVAYLFRGTTAGFTGSVYPRTGLTSMTVDPVVATLFAMTAAQFGNPLVYMISVSKLGGAIKDRRGRSFIADLEAEFVVAMSPTEIAGLPDAVAGDRARSLLEQLAVQFPPNIYNLADRDAALHLTKRLRSDEIEWFVHEAGDRR
jgi:hypothetical protein